MTEGSPASGATSSGAADLTTISSIGVTQTSSVTVTTHITVSSASESYASLSGYGSSSLTGVISVSSPALDKAVMTEADTSLQNATGMTGTGAMPSMTSSYVYGPGVPSNGQSTSLLAGAAGATASGAMPAAGSNGIMGTAAPSAQPFTGAAIPTFDSSVLLCMIISVAVAMLFV